MFILRDARISSQFPLVRLSICELLASDAANHGQTPFWKIEKQIFYFSAKLLTYATKLNPSQQHDFGEKVVSLDTVMHYFINVDRRTRGTTNNPSSSRSHILIFLSLVSSTDESKTSPTLIVGDFAGVENKFNCDDLVEIEAIYNSRQCKGDTRETCRRVYDDETILKDKTLHARGQCGAGNLDADLTLDLNSVDTRSASEKSANRYRFIDSSTFESSRQQLGLGGTNPTNLGRGNTLINKQVFEALQQSFKRPISNGGMRSLFPEYMRLRLDDIKYDHVIEMPAFQQLRDSSSLRMTIDLISFCVALELVYPALKTSQDWFPIFQDFWRDRTRSSTYPSEAKDTDDRVSQMMNESSMSLFDIFGFPQDFNRHRLPENAYWKEVSQTRADFSVPPNYEKIVLAPAEPIDNIRDLRKVANEYVDSFRILPASPNNATPAEKNAHVLLLMSAVSAYLWAISLDALSVYETSLQRLKAAVQICKCRSYEGKAINSALFVMRKAIRDVILIQQSDPGKLRTSPPFLDLCLPINCSPYDAACMEIVTPADALSKALANLTATENGGIIPVILKQIGISGLQTLKIAVFTVFLMSRKVTHDPPSPFIYAEGLRSEYARLKSSVPINDLCDKLQRHSYPVQKLEELKKSLAFYGLGGSLNVRKSVIIQLEKDIAMQEAALGATFSELMSKLKRISAEHNLISIQDFLTMIDTINAVHPIGTLQFADNIAKYNLVEKSCAFSEPLESSMLTQIHSKLAGKMKFSDVMNGLPYLVVPPGDVIAIHDREALRSGDVAEEEDYRNKLREEDEEDEEQRKSQKEEDEEEARRDREEKREQEILARQKAREEREAAREEAKERKERDKLRQEEERQIKEELARARKEKMSAMWKALKHH